MFEQLLQQAVEFIVSHMEDVEACDFTWQVAGRSHTLSFYSDDDGGDDLNSQGSDFSPRLTADIQHIISQGGFDGEE